MMNIRTLLLVSLAMFLFAPQHQCWSQEESDSSDSTSSQQDGPQTLFDEVRVLVEAGDIRDAAELVESRIGDGEEQLDVVDVQRCYRVLVASFARIRNGKDMYSQLEKLLAFQSARLDDERVLNQFANTLRQMVKASARSDVNKKEETLQILEDAIASVEPLANYESASPALVQLTDLKAIKVQRLVGDGKAQAAIELCRSEHDQLEPLFDSNPDDDVAAAVYVRSISNLMRVVKDDDERFKLYTKHQGIIQARMDGHPENMSYAVQYMTGIMFWANRQLMSDPEEVSELIDDAAEVLRSVVESNPNAKRALQNYANGLARMKSRALGQIRINSLIDQPAPELDAMNWINGEEISPEQLQGKVVLLDFWAVWCGPCIRTFPHLRNLHESFADEGLQIVGVTRHYNFTWNDETGRPQRGESDVQPEEEDDAILQFMEGHKLPYPTIVMPEGSQMNASFGVIGIPHVVLIDKKGVVRMVRVGAQPGNAEDVEAMIQKLLEE